MKVNYSILREFLEYDGKIGRFRWKKATPNDKNPKIGEIAGTVTHYGYRQIKFFGKVYKEHRLIWLYHHGEFPDKLIDHINGVIDDNRIENLRQVTHLQNSMNRDHKSNNKSGHRGIYYKKRRTKPYEVVSTVNWQTFYLGSYTTLEEALKVRDDFYKKHLGEFNRSNTLQENCYVA